MKNTVLLASIIIIVGVTVGGFIYYKKQSVSLPPIYNMSGRVVAVDVDSVTIKGALSNRAKVYSDKGPAPEQTIVFKVTPDTKYQKTLVLMTRDDKAEGGFTSRSFTSSGTFSDLAVGIPIIAVQGKGDLSGESKAMAVEIKYQLLEIKNEE